jgi:hypothetical protein
MRDVQFLTASEPSSTLSQWNRRAKRTYAETDWLARTDSARRSGDDWQGRGEIWS